MTDLDLNNPETKLFEIIVRKGFLTHIQTATLNKTEQSLKAKLIDYIKAQN